MSKSREAVIIPEQDEVKRKRKSPLHQAIILSQRYMRLLFNDRQRLMLLLFQAPLLALLIYIVSDGTQFEQYDMTKSLLFVLACSAFWIGTLNSIQEVCKERTILRREYMAGLSIPAYIASKIMVLGLFCAIQAFFIVGVFALLVGFPEKGVIINPLAEIYITTFLIALSATGMGLFVSALFKNADRAMTVAPLLLMPQILFSGLAFELSGATEVASWFVACRWGMESYGTISDLNRLPLKYQTMGFPVEHEVEDLFTYSRTHLGIAWLILFAYTIVFLIIGGIVLTKLKKEK